MLLCRCGQVVSTLFFCLSEVLSLLSHSSSGFFFLGTWNFVVIPNSSYMMVNVAATDSFTDFLYFLLVVPLLVGFLFQQVYCCSQLSPTLLCDRLEMEGKLD